MIFTLFFISSAALLLTNGAAKEPFFSKNESLQLIRHQSFKRLGRDFSGVTLVPDTDRILIIDDSCTILEMQVSSEAFNPLRSISVQGLEDCEAISTLSSSHESLSIAVAEERKGNIVVFNLRPKTKKITCPEDCEIYFVDKMQTFFRRNSGIEAMATQSLSDKKLFYIGKEEFPKKVYTGMLEKNEFKVKELWNAEESLPYEGDIAGMFFYQDQLFILDERMRRIRQVDAKTGVIFSELRLPKKKMFQIYEGIAFRKNASRNLEIIVVAEKNSVFLFQLVDNTH